MLRNLRKRVDIWGEWRRLKKTASYNPGRDIDGFFNKLEKFETFTNCCFILPAMKRSSLEREMIRNQIREDIMSIKMEKDPISRFDKLYDFLTKAPVNRENVKNPRVIVRLFEWTVILLEQNGKYVELYKLSTKIAVLKERIARLETKGD